MENHRFQHQMGDCQESEAIYTRGKGVQAMPAGKIIHPYN